MQIFPFVLVGAMPMTFSRQIWLIFLMAASQLIVILGWPWTWSAAPFDLMVDRLSSVLILNSIAIAIGLSLRRMRIRNFLRGLVASQEADAADSLLRLILPETAVRQLIEKGRVAPEIRRGHHLVHRLVGRRASPAHRRGETDPRARRDL